jgi:hypothetical protein
VVALVARPCIVANPSDRVDAGQRSHPDAKKSYTQKEDCAKEWHSANASGSHAAQKVARCVRKNE